MERLRQYMGRTIFPDRVVNADYLESLGITCTYFPEIPEEFDEYEFRTAFGTANIVVTIAVEQGQIKRILFSKADPENPDIIKSLASEELKEFLLKEENRLIRFFDYLTHPGEKGN